MQDRNDLPQHVVCFATPVQDALERLERPACARSRLEILAFEASDQLAVLLRISQGRRSARSTRTSVCVAVTISSSSSIR